MLKKFVFAIAVIALLMLTSCDSGLRIVGIYVSEYPDRIVYFSGLDDEIDLSGLEITLQTAEGTEQAIPYHDSEFDFRFTVAYDIDFDTAGVYIVYIDNGEYSCQFPVEVVTEENS